MLCDLRRVQILPRVTAVTTTVRASFAQRSSQAGLKGGNPDCHLRMNLRSTGQFSSYNSKLLNSKKNNWFSICFHDLLSALPFSAWILVNHWRETSRKHLCNVRKSRHELLDKILSTSSTFKCLKFALWPSWYCKTWHPRIFSVPSTKLLPGQAYAWACITRRGPALRTGLACWDCWHYQGQGLFSPGPQSRQLPLQRGSLSRSLQRAFQCPREDRLAFGAAQICSYGELEGLWIPAVWVPLDFCCRAWKLFWYAEWFSYLLWDFLQAALRAEDLEIIKRN